MAGTSVRKLAMVRAVKLPSYVLGGSRSFPRRAASQFLQSLGDSDGSATWCAVSASFNQSIFKFTSLLWPPGLFIC